MCVEFVNLCYRYSIVNFKWRVSALPSRISVCYT